MPNVTFQPAGRTVEVAPGVTVLEAARLAPVKPGWDIVVIARREAVGAGFREIQEAFLREMMKSSPRFRRLCIDRHGIGMNLAENLRSEFRSRVEGVALVGQVKESLSVGLKIAFENESVAIPRDRELTAHIHCIKKTATEAGYARFDTEKNERHHADKMWALSLAVHSTDSFRNTTRKMDGVSARVV